MSLTNQSEKFSLERDVHYLNCAYMSPLLKNVEEVGVKEMLRKRNPQHYSLDDFFKPVQDVKKMFSELINVSNSERIAIIPSVSYGLANAAQNIPVKKSGNVIICEGQFPSNYYIWKRKCDENGMKVEVVSKSNDWTESILDKISKDTAAVVLPQVHWADGTIFDLQKIGSKTRECEAMFIVDGTQSIGAFPFDMGEIEADAVICAGYKWLLGPYGIGLAYYGERFDNGIPIEENWLPKIKSDEFSGLTEYQEKHRPYAWRYNVGESSNFIYIAMLRESLHQILDWGVDNIQEYCQEVSEGAVSELRASGFQIDDLGKRASHLFGVLPPKGVDKNLIDQSLADSKVFVSKRGDFYRISPHVYNSIEDFQAMKEAFLISDI